MQALLDLKREQRGKRPTLAQMGERLNVSQQYLDREFRGLAVKGYMERRTENVDARSVTRWDLTDKGELWLKRTREFVTDDPPKRK